MYTIEESWKKYIDIDTINDIYESILEKTSPDLVCPQPEKWFTWTKCPADQIKVVILGMDPYKSLSEAHGLSFSSEDSKIPASLKNIFKCLYKHGMISSEIQSPNLLAWVNQGVLLLNTAFSTEVGKTGSHINEWKIFTTQLIVKFSAEIDPCVVMLWGNHAHGFEKYFDKKHYILKWIHPSPMAQTVAPEEKKFINCTHFAEANLILDKIGKGTINWSTESNSIRKEYSKEIKELDEVDEIGEKMNKVEGADMEEIDNILSRISTDCGVKVKNTTHLVFTDGACSKNGRKAAKGKYGAIFVNGKYAGTSIYGCLPKTGYPDTNIRAEGYAIYNVLIKIASEPEDWNVCQIFTDSEFWINMIQKYMPNWKPEKFATQKNPDLTTAIWEAYSKLSDKKVRFMYVPAHGKGDWNKSGDKYKEFCYINNNCVDNLVSYLNSIS